MEILGTNVHNLSLAQAIERAEGLLNNGKQNYIVTPNPEIVLRAWRDRNYRAILNKADLSIADGVGLLWASKILYPGYYIKERICGVDFIIHFLRNVRQNGLNVFLLGGRGDVAKKTARVLQTKFPEHSFYASGEIENKHLDFVINYIIQPDCIFVGLGAPKQEKWIDENLKAFPSIKLAMAVGGAFDILSGRLPRAPKIFRANGLEWMWRFMLQPWRAARIINAAVVFPFLVLREQNRRK